jgi:uncharacterized phage-associated protein
MDVAKYLLSMQDDDAGESITTLKLQKLLYYCQGFHLALFDEPLFDDRIEAWDHGPVVPSVYHEFKGYGRETLPIQLFDVDASLTHDQRELIDEVYTVYGQFSAWKLRNMTHDEMPWKKTFEEGQSTIRHEDLRAYFSTQLRRDEATS